MAHKVTIKGGVHPVLVDYECSQCDQIMEDVFYASRAAIRQEISCPDCGASAPRIISQRGNHIHSSHSSMYGKENPALGCVVRDYAHKQQLMKRLGVIEGADPVKGSRNHWKPKPERPVSAPESVWSDRPDSFHN